MKDVIWTAGAGRELQEVFEQLEDLYEGSGIRLIEEVQRMTALLSAQPLIGRIFEEPTRKLLVARRYGIIYSPEARGVVVAFFRGPAPRSPAASQKTPRLVWRALSRMSES